MAEGEGSTIGRMPEPGDAASDPSVDAASRGFSIQPPPARSWFPSSAPPPRPEPVVVCRFLRAEGPEGVLGAATAAVDTANRCVALGDPTPQSARQQELVCLTAAHANCPRFLRGVLLEETPVAPPAREPVSRAVVASALLLISAIAASFGFLAVRGGLTVALASPSPQPSQIALVPAASVVLLPSASPSLKPAPSASPSPSPSPIPTPSPSATHVPTPRPTATPRPSSDRYALLTPCPSTPGCWLYTVRAGDNLVSIAHYFGVPLETVYEMNPWARTTGLRAGQQLRLPPPTR